MAWILLLVYPKLTQPLTEPTKKGRTAAPKGHRAKGQNSDGRGSVDQSCGR
jgi:hypothetical protein